jgi:hypothetical protein
MFLPDQRRPLTDTERWGVVAGRSAYFLSLFAAIPGEPALPSFLPVPAIVAIPASIPHGLTASFPLE